MAETGDLRYELDAIQSSLSDAVKALDKLEGELDELTSERDSLKEDVADANSSYVALDEEREKLQARVTELEADHPEGGGAL